MPKVLITGMSGTGKTSVIEELLLRGHHAVETDDDEWLEWRTVPGIPGLDAGETVRDRVWREDRIRRLLDLAGDEPLVVSGCVSNQGRFYDRFDHVVLLSCAPGILFERLATRTTNSFGKAPEEREAIRRQIDVVEPMLRAGADLEIDTGATPLDGVVARVIALLAR